MMRISSFRRRLYVGLSVLLISVFIVLSGSAATAQAPQTVFWPVPPSPQELEKFAIPDSTPLLNALNPQSPYYGKIKIPTERIRRGPTESPAPDPSHAVFGTNIFKISPEGTNPGAYALQEVHPNLNLPPAPPDRTLYAPTLESPNYGRFEAVTYYRRDAGMDDTDRTFAIWDHLDCSHPSPKGPTCWAVLKPIDQVFLSNYVRPCQVGQCYSTIVMKYPDGWRVYLWNHLQQAWELQYSGMGNSLRDDGWDIWEAFFAGTCPSLPEIESYNIQVYTAEGWKSVTPTYGGEHNTMWCTWEYAYGWVNQYYHWYVVAP